MYLDDHDEVRMVFRVQKGYKKGRFFSNAPVFKYGVEFPKNPDHAMKLDKNNCNTFWQDAIDKEIKALL